MYFDKIINTAYSFGAAIVVFGAWAKIEHRDLGDTALTVGLLTETGIFVIYGLMEWRRKKKMEEQEPGAGAGKADVGGNGGEGADRRREGRSVGPVGSGGAAGMEMRPDTGELANVLKQTNQLLGKIFRAD